MSAIPLLRLSLPPQPLRRRPLTPLPHRSPTTIRCSYTPTPAADRLISAASYFLPFFNGIQYGRFLFAKYPVLAVPLQPLLPLLPVYHSHSTSFVVPLFVRYLGVVRNPWLSRYVQFNALQALVLDLLLVVPVLLQRIVGVGRSGIGLKLTAWAHSGLFLFVVACFVYGLVASVLGRTPYLPFVTDAAGSQFD